MAFTPWTFVYTPPKTVATPVPDRSGPGVVSVTAGSTPAESQASRLMGRLDELTATSAYLQQVVLARSKGLAVELNPAVEVDVARALEVIYGVDTAPAFVTVEMYDHLLDAQMAGLQIEMTLPADSPYEVNAFQTAAAAQIIKFVEDELVSTGEFRHQLPLLLRNLKGDTIIFDATKTELAKYPATRTGAPSAIDVVAYPINARTLDISAPLTGFMDGYLDATAGIYASVYKLASDISAVEREAATIVNTYVLQPAADVIRMVSVFRAMKGLLTVPRMKTLVNGLTGFVFVRLAAEAAGLRFFMDRFMSLAVTPLKSIVGVAGTALGAVQAMAMQASQAVSAVKNVKDTFKHTEGSLKGMSNAYDCGMPHNLNAPVPLKGQVGLDKAGHAINTAMGALTAAQQAPGQRLDQEMSKGMTALATHLKWGMEATESKNSMSDEAFKKLAARRLADQAAQLDLMCSTQTLDALLTMGQAVIGVVHAGLALATPTPAQQVEVVGRILASADSGTGAHFVMQDGTLQATPPGVPPVPATVEPVLRRGGLDRLAPDDLRSVTGVLP